MPETVLCTCKNTDNSSERKQRLPNICGGRSFMMDAVSEKLVLGTGGGAPPTAPSSETAGSLGTTGEARTHPGDDGVPAATDVSSMISLVIYMP